MIRPLATELVLFLTPFALYGAYLWATRAGVLDASSWRLQTLMWLTISALGLMIVSFLFIAEFSGAPPRSAYVPAHTENGRLVPGAQR
jgi:Family of unknown function (DUF6111)